MDLEILIPVKPLGEGKSRLAPVLDQSGRRALCERFLRNTLGLATSLAPVLVVTRDPVVIGIATQAGARIVDEPPVADLNVALDAGRRAVRPSTDLLVLPIDLPRLSAAALRTFCAARDAIAIAPDRNRDGTNLLLLPGRTVADFRFAYGIGSLAAHQAEAARLDVPLRLVDLAEAAFDVDSPEDHAEFARWAA